MKILILSSLLFCSLFGASPAFSASPHSPDSSAPAKKINILRNFQLSPLDASGTYGLSLFFEEAAPGRVSENISADGCGLVVRSAGNFLLSGRYLVNLEEETGPGSSGSLGFSGGGGAVGTNDAGGAVDRRTGWWKQYTNWGRAFDIRVTCRARGPISDDYVRKVMAGYVRIER